MDPLNLNSILKQLSEIARRRDVMKKKSHLDQRFIERKFEKKVSLNEDVVSVEKKEEDMLFESNKNIKMSRSKKERDKEKDSEKKNNFSSIKEDFKANFLDLRE